jgi:UTP-glucose-1-phosphate uridylyltransferase
MAPDHVTTALIPAALISAAGLTDGMPRLARAAVAGQGMVFHGRRYDRDDPPNYRQALRELVRPDPQVGPELRVRLPSTCAGERRECAG